MKKCLNLLISGLMALCLIQGLWPSGDSWGREKEAAESSRPIVITSNTLEADNKNKVAIFKGSVIAKQEQQGKDPILIYCDTMTVYYTEDAKKPASPPKGEKKGPSAENRVDKIVASGQVKIIQGKDVATGEMATFYNTDQKIVLTGNPKVWQGKNLVKGEEITVWIKENRSIVTSKGSNRVQAVIHQEEK
jgi:lipopolysaccharide export system protein LptA